MTPDDVPPAPATRETQPPRPPALADEPLPAPSASALETPEEFYARVIAHVGSDGRLPTLAEDAVSQWDIFPYEVEGLTVRRLAPLLEAEPPRRGEDPADCWCAVGRSHAPVWSNERWILSAGQSPLPFWGSLSPRAHHDLADLPLDLAAELGQLTAVIAAGMERLPSCGRAQVSKWGDGGAHLHLAFLARPARMGQLCGSCLPDWTEHLPVLPDDVATANIAAVVAHLVSELGGSAEGRAVPQG